MTSLLYNVKNVDIDVILYLQVPTTHNIAKQTGERKRGAKSKEQRANPERQPRTAIPNLERRTVNSEVVSGGTIALVAKRVGTIDRRGWCSATG
jgi:hypothetical protein